MDKFNLVRFVLILFVTKDVMAVTEAQKAIIQAKLLAGGVGCLKDHPLSLSDIKALRNKIMPEGDKAKCFAECLFKKIGIMDDMGKISATGAREQAMQIFKNNDEQMKKVDEFIEKCSSVNQQDMSEAGTKGCDRAKLAFTCMVENAPAIMRTTTSDPPSSSSGSFRIPWLPLPGVVKSFIDNSGRR